MQTQQPIAKVNDHFYYITNPNDTIQKYLYYGVQWNSAMIGVLQDIIQIKGLKHLVNVGAHIGTICIPLSKSISKISAVEPFFRTYIHLVDNIRLNQIDNIHHYNIALGDKKDTIYFMDDKIERIENNNGGMHVFTETDIVENRRSAEFVNKSLTGQMVRLDAFAEIDDFDIMFIDIEGMEDVFLQGAKEKIQKNKPVIIIEIWNNPKRVIENMNTTTEDIIFYIIELGYKLYKNINDDYIFLPLT